MVKMKTIVQFHKVHGIEPVEECGDVFCVYWHLTLRKICHIQTCSTEFKTFKVDVDSDFFDWDNRFSKAK